MIKLFNDKSNQDKAGIIFDEGFRNQYVENYMGTSRCYKNVFDEHTRNELTEYMFRKTTHWRTSKTGNLFFSGNLKPLIREVIYPIIKDIVPKEELDWDIVDNCGGNFFHTPHQYGIHTDMPEPDNNFDSDSVTYRSFLIPMYLLGRPECKIHMLYYDQRVVDSGCTLDYGPFASVTHYRSFTDYSKIDNVYTLDGPSKIDMNNKMSQEQFVNAGLDKAPSPIERYHGLTVENSFEWVPGDLHMFDTAQIHSSTLGDPAFKTKAGLRISLIAKRDYVKYP